MIKNSRSKRWEVANVIIIKYIKTKPEKKQKMMAWSKTTLGSKYNQRMVDGEIKKWRKDAGLPFPRRIRTPVQPESEPEDLIKSESDTN